MSTPHIEKLEIVVGDWPTDAGLVNFNGARTLFLRSGLVFSSAVRHVRNVLPHITLEAAERMVREQCPEFRDFDDMLGLTEPAPPSIERPPVEPEPEEPVAEPAPRKRRRQAVLVAALLPALAASWALGRYATQEPAPAPAKASAPDTAAAGVETAPFADEKFDFFAGASKIECDTVSAFEAECTDADGMVMSTKAATGPDSTIFTFSYGRQRIGLRIFYDADYAATWSRQEGSKQLYPHMQLHGRYVLWGTDTKRIREYMDLLVQADREAGPSAMGGMAPLPPRLAALTLGTLGLDRHAVDQIIHRPMLAATETPVIVAARLVLGLDAEPVWSDQNGDDIVAIAIGIVPPPVAAGAGTVTVPVPPAPVAPAPVPIVPAPASTPTPAPTPAAPTPAPPPPTEPSEPTTGTSPDPEPTPSEPTTPPSTQPETPTPAPSEPTEPPAEEEPPPADPEPAPEQPEEPSAPPAEDTPAPAEETPAPPPAEETPAPPAEETPAPVEETPAPPPAEETPAPAETTPAPVETPAEGAPPPGQAKKTAPADPAPGTDKGGDLLILDSAWTVAAP